MNGAFLEKKIYITDNSVDDFADIFHACTS